MRVLLPLFLTVAACAAQAEAVPSPWKGLWAVDAAVELPGDAKSAKDARSLGQVRRYYLRDPQPMALGERTFLVGKGIVDWQETVAVPLESVVALAQFTNNQVMALATRKDVETPIHAEKGKDINLEQPKK